MAKQTPPIASAIYDNGQVTYNYTDGTSETQDLDLVHQIDLFTEQLDEEYATRQEAVINKRIEEGRCINCGALREMTHLGLKECTKCSN